MTDERFCELDTNYTGEKIDNVVQLSQITFTGEELKEYVEHFVDAEIEELKYQVARKVNNIFSQQAKIKKLREALKYCDKISGSLIANPLLCIRNHCREALKDGK